MNNDIKEILEALRDSIDDTGTDKVNFINWVDKIEDYITNSQKSQETLIKNDNEIITNLQEELKSSNESITWWQNRFNALQKENERVKEYQESYKKELDYWRIQFSNKEDRIDKAIEYINKNLKISGMVDGTRYYCINRKSFDYEDLLNILQGDDKE